LGGNSKTGEGVGEMSLWPCVKCGKGFNDKLQKPKMFEGKKYCLDCWNIGNPNYTKTEDVINHPSHYHQNGIDVIGFSELQFNQDELKGFFRINVLKYVTRYDRKNNVEDLKKSRFYLDKLIEMEERKWLNQSLLKTKKD
jgi:hypothetical protein